MLQREVKELREAWFKQNAAEAVQVQREIQQENRELREAVEFYKQQARLTPVSERRVRPQDVARFAGYQIPAEYIFYTERRWLP